MKKFNVSFLLKIEEDNMILSSTEWEHEDDVQDLITDIMYDVDDTEIANLKVRERT